MLSAGILVAALFALLAFAPIASATPDPVGGGTTKLILKNEWRTYLKTFDIKVQKIKPAKQKGKNQLLFEANEGSLDPTNGLGYFSLKGGFKFKAGKKSVPVKAMVVNTNKMKIVAKVGGKKLKFATVKGLSYSRNGFGATVKLKKVKLTNAAANQLNKKTGYKKGKPKPFLKNKTIAKTWSNVQPSTVSILGEQTSTQLTLSAEALVKLKSLPIPVELSVVPPASVAGISSELTPIAAFPITGGEISPDAMAGTVLHSGGLKLDQKLELAKPGAGTTTLEMGNISLDFGARTASVEVSITNPAFPEGVAPNLGPLGTSSIADIDLSGAVITSDPANRKVSVTNGYATLQALTAATLNQVFSEPLGAGETFKPGDPLGHFSFTVQTQ